MVAPGNFATPGALRGSRLICEGSVGLSLGHVFDCQMRSILIVETQITSLLYYFVCQYFQTRDFVIHRFRKQYWNFQKTKFCIQVLSEQPLGDHEGDILFSVFSI